MFVRLQARVERETNNGDWRINPVDNLRIPYRRRTHAHSLVGFNFGIEFVAGANDLKPALSIGAGLSYRGLWEQD